MVQGELPVSKIKGSIPSRCGHRFCHRLLCELRLICQLSPCCPNALIPREINISYSRVPENCNQCAFGHTRPIPALGYVWITLYFSLCTYTPQHNLRISQSFDIVLFSYSHLTNFYYFYILFSQLLLELSGYHYINIIVHVLKL